MTDKKHGFATRAIHDGQAPDPLTGAVNVPIYLTSTYAQEEIGKHKGYEYSRVSNPTRDALEENLASLEGGTSAHVFASGMAAIMAMITMFRSGDHIICGENVYGGTPRLFNQIVTRYGIEFSYVDTSDPENVRRAIRPTTKLVHIETPTNPIMTLTDIRAVADVCHEKGVELAVDNTFMSPYFQRPIELGADIVMHSTTKFLNGHSDGLGGVLVGTRPKHKEDFAFVQKCTGGILSPFECWMILRGVKTLAVRMRQHEESGRKVAEFLAGHKRVQKVFYPGLTTHPQHELAKKQMSGFGALISFEMGSLENANAMLKRVKVCTLGESLGGVETLISHPATMTHAAIGAEARTKLGITDGLVRISVGIEDGDDLLADLEQALEVV
ncbi:cystathionine beta-lyase/cystathionine gamma-synthase [Silvibacterium bohemicum]|uniref:Cystathionine beta-lyase/cystathionine gamma-synthase n=1 Tax=Silvibacterium bohemicum TaxID=1577686 RepID=A0A841JUK3_9BACT|nr:PLP-dependent aspartate aminotransferase family protein [Silvibacterium bohemicum]MBB6142098.1 cystathionine beta-lyase/cystathionine gamma-synthase [Silvibacterium bohemicum]